MPSLKLTKAEARAIAAYLQTEHGRLAGPSEAGRLTVDLEKAERGRERFAELGCADCHELGLPQSSIASRLEAKPFNRLEAEAAGGCLATEPSGRAPKYSLSPAQRAALQAALKGGPVLSRPLDPAMRVRRTLASLNCQACHSREGWGGPSASRSDYFTTFSEYDLGDEGRLPPHLSGVGGKLRNDWLGQVLTNASVVRPYMAVRMPQFGALAVAGLIADFPAADATETTRQSAPTGDAKAGAELVGLNGYSCVNCHVFGAHPSLGIPAMDITRMAERLHWDWFRRYLLDPPSLRPGTRMPAFWPEGQASIATLLEGDTARQIAAIWAYLNLGPDAPPPPGLLENLDKATETAPAGYE
jgi:mono/diheme cytochrome c family protein